MAPATLSPNLSGHLALFDGAQNKTFINAFLIGEI
jgi:hypothetical protein